MDDETKRSGQSVKLPTSAGLYLARCGLKSADLDSFQLVRRPVRSRTRFFGYIQCIQLIYYVNYSSLMGLMLILAREYGHVRKPHLPRPLHLAQAPTLGKGSFHMFQSRDDHLPLNPRCGTW